MSACFNAERERAILLLRGQKVMLDSDLAALYEVETKQLLRAVKGNPDRCPADFTFQLTQPEFTNLRRQIGASSSAWEGRRTRPWAFTGQGVAMLYEWPSLFFKVNGGQGVFIFGGGVFCAQGVQRCQGPLACARLVDGVACLPLSCIL
jgi:hypothetical protein